MTYTLALLEVLPSTHEDVTTRLERAGYTHAIDTESGRLNMTGLALVPMQPPQAFIVKKPPTEEQLARDRSGQFQKHLIVEGRPDTSTTLKSFRHYKGGSYTLLMVGRSSEARDEHFAVYVSHQTQQVWIRPWGMFCELVEWPDGVMRPRFTEWTNDDPATK